MDKRLDHFVGLSAALTGFGRLQLLGTGVAAQYLGKLDDAMPGAADELLGAWKPGMAEEDIESKILGDVKLGTIAQTLILLWYLGAWVDPATKATTYVSADSYQAALQWVAAGAHPPGSRQEGFGSWGWLPEGGLL
jgi:hypothetical protein